MYEDKSYQNVLSSLLSYVPHDLDKREGSVIYNALAPVAMEITKLYQDMGEILNETFADTASRYYLVKRAAERGVAPRGATYAVVKGKFDIEIPIGKRFSGGAMNYTVKDKIEDEEESALYYYRLACESPGSAGNWYTGQLVPISEDDLGGLTIAEITEVLVGGEDEEDTESFRQRYFSGITSQAFGGNEADYIEKVSALQDVGGVRVYPVWNGGGTVKLVIVNSDCAVPSNALVASVQEAVDPSDSSGDGIGIAPIGHSVTVQAAVADTVNIALSCTYETGSAWDDVKGNIKIVIDDYLAELNQSWKMPDKEKIVVRVSHLESRILGVGGIKDVTAVINATVGNHEAPETAVVKLGTLSEVTV